jgi:D-Tyr-tRNAtyr deacylase
LKVLKIAAVVVGTIAGVAAIATGFGAPLGVGILGATWGTIAATAGLVSAGLNLLSPAKPKQGSAVGSVTEWRADPQAGIPYIMGRAAYGGNIVHRDTWGTEGAYFGNVFVWSGGGPVEEIEAFQIERASVSFSGNAATGTWAGFVWLDRQLGAVPEPTALAPTNGTMPGWDSASDLSGYCAGLLETKFDKDGKKWAGGFPSNLMAIIKGVKVYDPRLDSTYPGGSGSHRHDDEDTWAYSTNPWLHAITWWLGRHQNGKRVLGIGGPADGIDLPRYVDAANMADTNSWTISGVISSLDSKWEVLKKICQAGGGVPIRLGGMLSCDFNAPRVSLATITAKDIVGDTRIVATQPRRERINTAIPRLRLESQGWEVTSLSPISINDYVTEDGGTRTREMDFELVNDANQAAELGLYEVANSREFGPISLGLKVQWIGYKPGDCLTLDVDELGLDGQAAVVTRRELDPESAVASLDFVSETAAKHPFCLGQTGTPPPTPSLTPIDLSNVPSPGSSAWDVDPVQLTGTGGQALPALRVTGAVDNPNAEAIVIEIREDGATDWTGMEMHSPDLASRDLLNVKPGFDYEVAVSYIVRGVRSDRLILGPVTAGTIDGIEGAAGLNNATVFLFKRSATTPTVPSTTATYTFATSALTGHNNGWTQTVPAADGNPLWVTAAAASSSSATDTIAAGEWASPVIQAQDGADGGTGANGLNTATVFLYQRAASTPSVPGSTTTYTFATGALSGTLGSWTQTVPAHNGNPLYVTTATALSANTTDTIATGEWATPRVMAQDGAAGSAGTNNATVFLFRRNATTPAVPSTTATYTFATAALTGHNNSWTQTVPAANGQPLWVTAATASSSGATDTIATGEWASPVIQAQDGATGATGGTGAAGLNAATVFLFQRAASSPSVPGSTLTYTFATGVLSGTLGSWTQTVPAHNGNPLYVITATALSSSTTDTIATGEWSAVRVLAENGNDGYAFDLSAGSLVVEADYAGTIKVGQLPRTVTGTLRQGTTNVTGSATWTIDAESGCDASISGAIASLDDVTGSGYFDMKVVYGSFSQVRRVGVTMTLDAAPGGNGDEAQTTWTWPSVSSTSYPSDPLSIMVVRSNASGEIAMSMGVTYTPPVPGSLGTNSLQLAGKAVYRPVSGGAWSDFPDPSPGIADGETRGTVGTGRRFETSPGEQETDQTTGSLSFAGTKTGLTANTQYQVGVMLRRFAGTYTSGYVPYGSATFDGL